MQQISQEALISNFVVAHPQISALSGTFSGQLILNFISMKVLWKRTPYPSSPSLSDKKTNFKGKERQKDSRKGKK